MRGRMKGLAALVLALAAVTALLCGNAWAANSGKCGEYVKWTLSGSTLTVSGKGAMYNYDNDAPDKAEPRTPWYARRGEVRQLVVEPGVTRIGRYAFDGCGNLTEVTLPPTLRSVGALSFASCGSLKGIVLPGRVKNVGDSIFFDWDEATDRERSALGAVFFQGDAPNLYDSGGDGLYGTFDSVSATAWYPAGNRTWTGAKRKNYGGKLTWRKWNPYTTTLTKVKAGRRKALVRWKKNAKATGYQIQYARNNTFRRAKLKTVKGAGRTAVTLKKLKRKKKYYVRVRTYKVDAGKKYYSDWSGAKGVKVKK